MSILDAVPGVSQAKLVGAGICLLGIIGLGIYIWGLKTEIHSKETKIEQLQTDNKQLTINVETVKQNFNECSNTNKSQNDTINSLLKEREDVKKAINDLSSKALKSDSTVQALRKQLADLNSDTANNGPLAKNLRETIRGIQSKGDVK